MTKICDDLSNPEDCAERLVRRRALRTITEKGGCWFCKHRDPKVEHWGRSVCEANHARSFPLCTKDGQSPAFELDEDRLKEETHVR